MAGTFNKSVRPKLAGSFFNWEAEPPIAPPAVLPGAVVAIPGVHNWGPFRAAGLFRSPEAFDAVFGKGDTAGRRAVHNAFRGFGLPGKAGAGAVLFYRQGTAAADEAVLTLDNTAAADALTLTARYRGTRGNDLDVTVQAGAVAGTKDLLVILDGAVVERYNHAQADLAALAAEINDDSDWITAAVVADGTALANVATVSLAGGLDGEVLTAAEHTQAMDAFSAERFGIVAPANLTDDAIRTSYVAWQAQENTIGKRMRLVVGGAAGETFATGNARSEAINDWNVANVVGPALHDDVLDRDFSGAELAPRVAGALASLGEKYDLIYGRFADLSVPEGTSLASLAEQEAALDSGSIVFSRDTNQDAPVFVREGVTTYTDDSDSPLDDDGNKTKPVDQYRRIKNIAIQQGIEMAVDDWATSEDVFGRLPVNDRVRALVLGRVAEEYRTREENEIVQPGWDVELDPTVPVSDDDDFVFYRHGFHPTRSLRQMFHTARVG